MLQSRYIILPYPSLTVPERRPLAICSNPTFTEFFNTDSDPPIWENWFSNPDSIYLLGARRPPFEHLSFRKADEQLSAFALILNADSKLQHALVHRPDAHPMPAGLKEIAITVRQFVDHLLFDPLNEIDTENWLNRLLLDSDVEMTV